MKALLKEAADAIGLSKNALYWMARRGDVPHLRIGNRYVFDTEQVQEHLRQQALKNMAQTQNEENHYGVLRKIQ